MTERNSMDEQSNRVSETGDNHFSAADFSRDQQQFNEWLAAARLSEDVRNRIAVAGGTISSGVFGKLYLLVPNGQLAVATAECDQHMQGQAANDPEYEQPLASSTRNL